MTKKETFSQMILNNSYFLKAYNKIVHPIFLSFFAHKKMNFVVVYHDLLALDPESQTSKKSIPENILDLACGTGWYGRKLRLEHKEQGTCIYAVDIATNTLKIAQKEKIKYGFGDNFQIINWNAEKLDLFEDNSFHEIWICGALHQMPHVDLVLNEITRLLDQDGKLFCQTFVKDEQAHSLIIRLCEKLGHHFFTKEELVIKLRQRNLKLINYSRSGLVALFYAQRTAD
ncbi:class I SAM-dependent methyltransferase [Lactobacillus sp. DCY120]|uniref:Class I SAM-dependent methyltransferase n=1 Tax=Bombilactobacillus apium TaxID=2675299 RepID=A0A850R957_9LACO|nr:class I SAM-dependent methyltransferase [Bombilactobacillus apium]NVY95936.1 class I SAM-dependent methyltransferase [Bombilactobacillus apium]